MFFIYSFFKTRIAAYLSLVKCPSPDIFQKIADIQMNERSKQVGSFVWSHLTNAMESTEPLHGLPLATMIKKALNGTKLREFNLNRLRFSRAYEGSAYSGKLLFHCTKLIHFNFTKMTIELQTFKNF